MYSIPYSHASCLTLIVVFCWNYYWFSFVKISCAVLFALKGICVGHMFLVIILSRVIKHLITSCLFLKVVVIVTYNVNSTLILCGDKIMFSFSGLIDMMLEIYCISIFKDQRATCILIQEIWYNFIAPHNIVLIHKCIVSRILTYERKDIKSMFLLFPGRFVTNDMFYVLIWCCCTGHVTFSNVEVFMSGIGLLIYL